MPSLPRSNRAGLLLAALAFGGTAALLWARSPRAGTDARSLPVAAAVSPDGIPAALAPGPATDSCAECHRGLHPDLVRAHESGPHARTASCADCHGSDHAAIFSIDGQVSSARCGSCHAKRYEEFRRSRHGRRMKDGAIDATLTAHARAVGGCTAANGCHDVQRANADGSVGRCASCHTSHSFAKEDAKDPAMCARCHSGPDHPQWEAWTNDKHGVLWRRYPTSGISAACADCHLPEGNHDDSIGITAAVVLPAGQPKPTLVSTMSAREHAVARDAMVAVCVRCHGARISRDTLRAGDEARFDGLLLCEEAAGIVRDLDAEGLLVPAPKDRARNPAGKGALVLGARQIYDEDSSRAERLFYDMFMFDWPALWRAAYHTDPNLLRWTRREKLKSDLVEIRQEALRLREGRKAPER
jgi:hypothetical protein